MLLLMLDTVDYPVAFWGAIRAGIVPIPLNTLLRPEQYAYNLADGRAEAIVISAPLLPALASVLGLLLLIQGAFEITRAIVSKPENDLWWLSLISGILLILLAFWVSSSDRVFNLAGRAALILFWVGFMAIFRGFSLIAMAFAVRHAGKRVATS